MDEHQEVGSGVRQISALKSFFFLVAQPKSKMGLVKILVKRGWDNPFNQINVPSPTITFRIKIDFFSPRSFAMIPSQYSQYSFATVPAWRAAPNPQKFPLR